MQHMHLNITEDEEETKKKQKMCAQKPLFPIFIIAFFRYC